MIRLRENQREAIAMKLSGMTYQEIAAKIGVSRQCAQQRIRPAYPIREEVRRRASYRCQRCSRDERSGHVHHISHSVTVEEWNDYANLLYVCSSCHRALHNIEAAPATFMQPPTKEHCGQRDGHGRTLTPRERQVVHLSTSEALTTREIATRLGLSPKTISVHRGNIYRKLKVRNVAELYRALVENLIPDSGR